MSETVPEFCHWFATAPQFWLNVQLKQSAQTLSHFHQFIIFWTSCESNCQYHWGGIRQHFSVTEVQLWRWIRLNSFAKKHSCPSVHSVTNSCERQNVLVPCRQLVIMSESTHIAPAREAHTEDLVPRIGQDAEKLRSGFALDILQQSITIGV
jgi:hypothetical protein